MAPCWDEVPFSLSLTKARGDRCPRWIWIGSGATRNRVALSFLPNMRGDLDPVERVLHVTMAFQLQDDSEGLRKFFAFWVVEGRLQVAQQVDLNRRLKEMGMPEIIEWWLEEGHAKGRLEGLEEGIRASKREDARKMLAEGFGWDVITRITGIKPEDLI
jgi:hypothetical protein